MTGRIYGPHRPAKAISADITAARLAWPRQPGRYEMLIAELNAQHLHAAAYHRSRFTDAEWAARVVAGRERAARLVAEWLDARAGVSS